MISHYNVIANILQYVTYESVGRSRRGVTSQVSLGLLPYSHIYGLVVVTHGSTYRGDEIIVLPKYELNLFLAAVQRFRIEHLPLVPPILIQVLRNPETVKKYDLGSVRFVYTGAAPLGGETVREVLQVFPEWIVGQGYGQCSRFGSYLGRPAMPVEAGRPS